MRSQKRYTNVGFTKRVDHDAGRHRTVRAPHEPARCTGCGAIYHARRWVLPEAVPRDVRQSRCESTLCPACVAREEGVASGFVHVRGAFVSAHREEIERLLHNEEARTREDNPLAQIVGREPAIDGTLLVKTSTVHLAQRLGHALHKAFGGEVNYRFSHENPVAHVYWRRES